MKNETIPVQDPPQLPRKPKESSSSKQLPLFLEGGFGKKRDDERLLDLFRDAEQGQDQHPYGAGAC